MLGAAAAVAVLFTFSALVLPVRSWGDWLHKVAQLSSDPHPSHISLRSFVAGWEYDQHSVLRQRLPVFIAGVAFFLVMVALSARGKRPEQAALLGLPLIPVLMYPGNYYIHFIFLLPLVVQERPWDRASARAPGGTVIPPLSATDAGIWATLLFLCAGQYLSVIVLPDLALHFYQNSVLLFAALTLMLFLLARQTALAAGWFRPAVTEPAPVADRL